jgi:hypothetical protein
MSLEKSLENLKKVVKECKNVTSYSSHPNTINANNIILTHCKVTLKEVENLKETTLEDDQDALTEIGLIMILIHWHNDKDPINQCMCEIHKKLDERISNKLPQKKQSNVFSFINSPK